MPTDVKRSSRKRPITGRKDPVSTMAEPLSIAMIAPCPFPTGQGTQVLIRHLATTLAKAGHEVHLITYGYGEYDDDFEFHLHRAAKVQAGLRSGPSLLKPAADAALLLTASRVIKAHGCSLMHVHNVEGLGLGALLKLQTSLPMVYHAHNAMGPELPTYFSAQVAQAFASMLGEVFDRTLPRTADAVITFNADHKSLHEMYGVDERRLFVIPPGIDHTEIAEVEEHHVEAARERFGPGPWLLYAGNPDGYQNLALLWNAFAKVREQRPDAKLLVVSSHQPSAFDEPLKQAPSREGIVVHQFSDLNELRAVFAIADIGLSPRSLWIGTPIKILNYLAVGLPTVVVRTGARHLVSSDNAMVVDEDPEEFAAACLELLNNPGDWRAKHRRTLEQFRIENHVELYENVYRQVLGVTA